MAENQPVDNTPISPVERRNSLEKHLQTRPDPQDLKDRHILLDTNAAPCVIFLDSLHTELSLRRSLQAAAQELERQRATDNLKKGLERRPERDELVEREYPTHISFAPYRDDNHAAGNILPDTTAAPALQEKQKELEKHMRMNSLEQKLQNRPKPDELVKDGILGADENPIQE